MNLQFAPDTDPNTLPYFITEAATGRKIQVRFEPLTIGDEAELQTTWTEAIYYAAWLQMIGADGVLKLVAAEAQESSQIVGLVCVGNYEQGIDVVTDSLLETVPLSQFGTAQKYKGVGRVLVARLAVECFAHGGQGKVVVQPRPGSEPFYYALGFVPVSVTSRRLILGIAQSASLLAFVSSQSEISKSQQDKNR